MELGVSHEQSLSSSTPIVDNIFDKYNKNLVPIRSLSDHDIIFNPTSYGWVFKSWGWTLWASVEHLWQDAPSDTESVHSLWTHTPTTVHTVSHFVDPFALQLIQCRKVLKLVCHSLPQLNPPNLAFVELS